VSMRAEVHKGGDDGLRLRWLLVAIEAVGQWEVLAGKEGQAGAPGAEGQLASTLVVEFSGRCAV
jgi:hypothetical protein